MTVHMRQTSPRFVVGSEGRKREVVLAVTDYRRLLRRIEDLEDSLTLDRTAQTSKKLVPYEAVRKRLRRAGKL
jgi:hypothetical protein